METAIRKCRHIIRDVQNLYLDRPIGKALKDLINLSHIFVALEAHACRGDDKTTCDNIGRILAQNDAALRDACKVLKMPRWRECDGTEEEYTATRAAFQDMKKTFQAWYAGTGLGTYAFLPRVFTWPLPCRLCAVFEEYKALLIKVGAPSDTLIRTEDV
jgi:hypothetical protein